jgi:hypothetical protein
VPLSAANVQYADCRPTPQDLLSSNPDDQIDRFWALESRRCRYSNNGRNSGHCEHRLSTFMDWIFNDIAVCTIAAIDLGRLCHCGVSFETHDRYGCGEPTMSTRRSLFSSPPTRQNSLDNFVAVDPSRGEVVKVILLAQSGRSEKFVSELGGEARPKSRRLVCSCGGAPVYSV